MNSVSANHFRKRSNVTSGIHRHVDMIVPRILDLKQLNEEKLASGKLKMADVVITAGARLMVG